MGRGLVLVDTSALLALINRTDQWHRQAVAVSQQLADDKRPLITTEWILTEFLGGAARPPLRALARQAVENLWASDKVEIVEANHADWKAGFDLYEARSDKTWSLVDCTSIRLCESRSIGEVLSGDHHFEQAGLRILLGYTD